MCLVFFGLHLQVVIHSNAITCSWCQPRAPTPRPKSRVFGDTTAVKSHLDPCFEDKVVPPDGPQQLTPLSPREMPTQRQTGWYHHGRAPYCDLEKPTEFSSHARAVTGEQYFSQTYVCVLHHHYRPNRDVNLEHVVFVLSTQASRMCAPLRGHPSRLFSTYNTACAYGV